MKIKIPKDDALIHLIIVLSCIIAIGIFLAVQLNPPASFPAVYLSDYPNSIAFGQNISFSVTVNTGEMEKQLTADIYFDDTKNTTMLLPMKGNYTFAFDLPNSLPRGQHKISIDFYYADKPYQQYGSPMKPYYILFRVEIV